MKDIIIKSGNIINPGGEVSGYHDIYIKDGIIIGIDEDNTKLNSPIIIDAENCIICPGLVDLSVRFRQPGLEKEATILSESMAAVSSGVTTVCYMPDTQPVIDTPAQIKLVEEIFKNVNLCKVKVLASLTKDLDGNRLSPMIKASWCCWIDKLLKSYSRFISFKKSNGICFWAEYDNFLSTSK